MANSLDLAKLFSSASKVLSKNQTNLNQADTHNHDHGDNMVEVFTVITQAMKEKKGASSADQLEYASQLLRQKTQSGSGQVYAQGLERAAQAFTGKQVTKQNVGTLIQTLFGAQQVTAQPATSGGADLLGTLVSSLTGGGGQAASGQGAQSAGGGDLLGSLVSSLAGGGGQAASGQGGQGLDAGDLLNAGLSYMSAKKAGKGDLEALMGAVVNSSAVGQEAHRAESGTLIANALLGALTKMK